MSFIFLSFLLFFSSLFSAGAVSFVTSPIKSSIDVDRSVPGGKAPGGGAPKPGLGGSAPGWLGKAPGRDGIAPFVGVKGRPWGGNEGAGAPGGNADGAP